MGDLFKAMTAFLIAPILILIALYVMKVTFSVIGVDPAPVLSLVIATTPVWLPFILFYLAYDKWLDFVRLQFKIKQGRSTLRLRLPQEVYKSPEAMENVLAVAFNVQSIDNLWQAYIDGKHPLVMSLEIVSIGGDMRLYINCATRKVKDGIEAQLYAQYPGIEIVEEEFDYTAEFTADLDKYDAFSVHIKQKGDEEFPIKTYIDFGMDKLPKEEQKFEPMAAMIEQLSTIKPHERSMVQILCIPHTKKSFKTGYLHGHGTWEHKIQEKIDEMMGRSHDHTGPAEFENQPRLTTGERDTIAAMERNMGKYAYEVAIRWLYITKKGTFNGDLIAPTLRTFAQYDLIGRNQLGVAWRTDYDYNWFMDWSGKRKNYLKKKEIKNYKLRKKLYGSAINPDMKFQIMSVEELATIFHIPSSIVMTPGLSRLPSTRREAPSNLPTGNPGQ